MGVLHLFPLLVCMILEVEANIQGELCTDISTYTDVQWHSGEKCCKQGIGKPLCTLRPTRVCTTHQETKCRIEVKDEVEMEDCPIKTSMIAREEHVFQPFKAVPEPYEIVHTKYNFTCENKTRQNCETIWVTDSSGIKTAKQGDCDEVVWLDCYKTPYNATFTTYRHKKVPAQQIRYNTCVNMTVEVMQMCFHVKKVAVSVCETVPREECKSDKEKWCEPQLGEGDCISAGDIPWQQRIHKEKCLQPGKGSEQQGKGRSLGDLNGDHHGDHHEDHNGDHHEGHEPHETVTPGFPFLNTERRNGKSEQEFEEKTHEGESLFERLNKIKNGQLGISI